MKVILEDVTKKFPNRNKKEDDVTAVSHFSYEIPDGKLIGMLGPSGCGKSTTLFMICGLEMPTEGKIFFGEDEVTEIPPENRGVGIVFQNYALYPHLTVKQNILFPLQNLKGKDKLSKEDMSKRAYEAAKLVQIEELMERKPNELSGGQQQRVAIARAMVKMPKVLLLDEPLSNLDARLRLQTREEIRRIQKETGITTIFVTHDQEEAMSISDEIVVMKDGEIHQTGRPQDVYDDPTNLFVAKFLGTPPINVFDGVIRQGKLYLDNCSSPESNISTDTDAPSTESNTSKTASAAVMNTPDIPDQEVVVGIRPEGFIPDENGPLVCNLTGIEVMGRDITVISTHPYCQNTAIRSIVSAENKIDTTKENIRFSLKQEKVLIFNKNTEERIRF